MPVEMSAIRIVRRPVKYARLRVCQDGAVELIAPAHLSEKRVAELLHDRSEWIAEKQRYFRQRMPLAPHDDGLSIMLFGDLFSVTRDIALRTVVRIDTKERRLVTGRDLADVAVRRRWLRHLARARLPERVRELAETHGFKFNRVYVRSQKSRWGSCSEYRNISLNWQLVHAPQPVIDYVILHELVHTRVLNHGIRFWALLSRVCPSHAESAAWLRQHFPSATVG